MRDSGFKNMDFRVMIVVGGLALSDVYVVAHEFFEDVGYGSVV